LSDYGLTRLFPNAQELGLQDCPVLGVGAARLVHQQHRGVGDEARAIAARWRMPPDNWCG
jgi:hypothetical protein